jgi:hypothetical protein
VALRFPLPPPGGTKPETKNPPDKSMDNAEKAYEAVIHCLSDPKHSKHLTVEEIQEMTAELERLRGRLDGLQRFRKRRTEIKQEVTPQIDQPNGVRICNSD